MQYAIFYVNDKGTEVEGSRPSMSSLQVCRRGEYSQGAQQMTLTYTLCALIFFWPMRLQVTFLRIDLFHVESCKWQLQQ